MKTTAPLSGRGTTIYYEDYNGGYTVKWGKIKFIISILLI